jgi:poly(3-hydroxybutyrate) depolymerase
VNISEGRGFVGVWPDGSGDCLGEDPGCDHSWEACSACSQGWNAGGTGATHGAAGLTCNTDRAAWGAYSCYKSCGTVCAPSPVDNSTTTCLASSCWDDVGFVIELLDWLDERVCLDRNRIHLSGLSNGAMMALQLAHAISHRIASIVPVAGLPLLGFLGEAVPSVPVAMMVINGRLDQTVPANTSNGFLGAEEHRSTHAMCCRSISFCRIHRFAAPDHRECASAGAPGPMGSSYSSDGFYYTPVDNLTAAFREVNGCGAARDLRAYETPHDGELWWRCVEPYGACHSGAALVRCSSLAAHNWPDFSKNATDCYTDTCLENGGNCPFLKFAEIAWAFFEANPRSASAAAAAHNNNARTRYDTQY